MKFPYEPTGENIFAERLDDFDSLMFRGVDPKLRDKQGLRAKVIAVGPSVLHVKPGEVILIGRATGVELNVGGRHVVGLREGDALAVLDRAH